MDRGNESFKPAFPNANPKRKSFVCRPIHSALFRKTSISLITASDDPLVQHLPVSGGGRPAARANERDSAS